MSVPKPLPPASHHQFMNVAGWENMYRSGERGSEDHPTQLLIDTVAALQPGTAVDLACGTGRNALFLAELGWQVTAIDGSATAINTLKARASACGLNIETQVTDLASPEFALPDCGFDLIVIAYYLQRDLFGKVEPALRPGGLVLAIVHIPSPGEEPSLKRAAPGELPTLFAGWEVLHYYEGASRDPAHKRPVAEILARKPQ